MVVHRNAYQIKMVTFQTIELLFPKLPILKDLPVSTSVSYNQANTNRDGGFHILHDEQQT